MAASPEALVVETDRELNAKELLITLGGTIKLGEVLFTLALDKSEEELFTIFSPDTLLKHFFTHIKGKLHFGLSLYYLDGEGSSIKNYKKLLEKLSIYIKKQLQQKNQSAGFVRIKDRFLSSVSVDKNELLTKGAELLLIASADKLYLGKTLYVQEFASYSFRDYSRPRRDRRSGMLPPKIAQIMLNLSQSSKEDIILDPFCGSGTILSEAAFSGYQNLLGSDISFEAVSATRENLNWLKIQYPQKLTAVKSKIFLSDVTELSSKVSPNSINAVITEPYLGPPFNRQPGLNEINNVIRDLGILYENSFKQFARILKNQSRIVIVFPAFKSDGKMHIINILDSISQLGFTQRMILPSDLNQQYSQLLTDRKTFIYGRGDEFVFREILVFDFR